MRRLLVVSVLALASCGPSDSDRASWERACKEAGVYDAVTLARCRESAEQAKSIASAAAHEAASKKMIEQAMELEKHRAIERKKSEAGESCKRPVAPYANKQRQTAAGEYKDTWFWMPGPYGIQGGYVELTQEVFTQQPPLVFNYRCKVADDGAVTLPELRVSHFIDTNGGLPVDRYAPIDSMQ